MTKRNVQRARDMDKTQPGVDTDPPQGVRRPNRLAARPKANVEISVNVGIDFGTSSTKVFVRDLHHEKMYACLFEDNPDGYPPICMPSTVSVENKRVYFGAEGERRRDGVRLRSMKMCLRCRNKCDSCSYCPNELAGAKAGWFLLPGESQEPVPAEEVCAWFLAHVIGAIQIRSARLFQNYSVRLSYQMAAPLGMFENEASRMSFERVLFIAERLSGNVTQGIELDELRSAYQGISLTAVDLPSGAERVTFVQPETHAATIGYAASRRAVEGLYGIVDIGAGTTDISFFRLGRQGQRLAYYSADTIPFGGDYVDRLILGRLSQGANGMEELSPLTRANLLESIRIAKQKFRGEAISLATGFSLGQEEFEASAGALGKELFSQYRRIWGQAYEKEKRENRWRDGFTLFLIGGGSELGPAVAPLGATPDKQFVKRIHLDHLDLPDGIASDPPNRVQVVYEHSKLLMVACGLSHHVAESPEFFLPKEIEPLSAPEPIPQGVDDFGKDGQWW